MSCSPGKGAVVSTDRARRPGRRPCCRQEMSSPGAWKRRVRRSGQAVDRGAAVREHVGRSGTGVLRRRHGRGNRHSAVEGAVALPLAQPQLCLQAPGGGPGLRTLKRRLGADPASDHTAVIFATPIGNTPSLGSRPARIAPIHRTRVSGGIAHERGRFFRRRLVSRFAKPSG
jgi:hypothetical protein